MAVNLGLFKAKKTIAGRGLEVQLLWLLVGLPLLRSTWLIGSVWRVFLLRLFGAEVGDNVQIKSGVRVKYPWKLRVGDNSWIGEDCWIDNLEFVVLGDNVCLSQACYLCTGNHDWKDPAFQMFARPITLEDGSWVASRCTLGPGVTIGRNGIAAIGSVVWSSIPPNEIHGGNPCVLRGLRVLNEPELFGDGSEVDTPSDVHTKSCLV